jgi:hypothetical protein
MRAAELRRHKEGIPTNLINEGYSPVLKAVGRHQWIEGDFDALCAALLE